MFLETDGNLAWLSCCPYVSSPLHNINQCYDKIPIIYNGQKQFVDPFARQALPMLCRNIAQTGSKTFSKWIWIKKIRGIP